MGAQLEDGYTRIANEILEQLSRTRLNGTQFRIVNAVLRYTYGFNRKQHELSESFLAEATGCHKKQVARELKALIEQKILLVVKEATFTTGRVIAFNKYYQSWQGTELTPGSELVPSPPDSWFPGSELAGSLGANPLPKKDNFKDNIKENIFTLLAPEEPTKNTDPETVFDHWNGKGIIKHKVLTDKIKRSISGKLKYHSPEELNTAIDNYHLILSGKEYYFNYKWTLKDFLDRGLDKFMDLKIAADNYRKSVCEPINPASRDGPVIYDFMGYKIEHRITHNDYYCSALNMGHESKYKLEEHIKKAVILESG